MAAESTEKEERSPAWQMAIAAGASGMVSRAACQPLDVIRIRFQLQTEPLRSGAGAKYWGVSQALGRIAREEGVSALWSGHVPAQWLSISYGILQLVSYEKIVEASEAVAPHLFERYRSSVTFFAGTSSAAFATTVSYPFDTLRTRLVAEAKTQRVYVGMFGAARTICRDEGARALFKGLAPTVMSIAPLSGIRFVVFRWLLDSPLSRLPVFRRAENESLESSAPLNVVAGALSGAFAKTVVYPVDLGKRRLQIQGFQHHRATFGRQFFCHGFFHCVDLMVRNEGFLSLYKGLYPSLLKALVGNALIFSVYYEVKKLLR